MSKLITKVDDVERSRYKLRLLLSSCCLHLTLRSDVEYACGSHPGHLRRRSEGSRECSWCPRVRVVTDGNARLFRRRLNLDDSYRSLKIFTGLCSGSQRKTSTASSRETFWPSRNVPTCIKIKRSVLDQFANGTRTDGVFLHRVKARLSNLRPSVLKSRNNIRR